MSDESGANDGSSQPPDEFAHLFRPESDSEGQPAPGTPQTHLPGEEALEWEPLVAVPEPIDPRLDPPLDPPLEAAGFAGFENFENVEDVEDVEQVESIEDPSPKPLPPAKEGRLFRSRRAPQRPDAVTAIAGMQARRLRTLREADEASVVEPVPALEPVLPVVASGEPAPALQVMARPAPTQSASEERPRRSRRDHDRPNIRSSGSLTALGVYAVTIGVTVILAFGETLFFGGEPGLITGIGLVGVSIVAAFVVRTRDGLHAIFAPSIAFLIAALTAGQIGLNVTDLANRAVVVFFLLGNNWPWIIGATAASLLIVALRRRVG